MPIQKCPLCLETKNVVSSHLIPAAIYDYCRTEDSSPARIGDGVVMHTDRQLQDYLLCLDCEDLLNKKGETWVNPKLARLNNGFPLYELLVSSPADMQDETGAAYSTARNPLIDAEKLTHFAMGIFWKASVHPWRGNGKSPLIELGPYSDKVRTWLRAETAFPKHVCLSVSLSRPERANISLGGPIQSNAKPPGRHFFFHVPGTLFTLSVGKQLESEMKMTCFHENPGHPIFVSDEVTGTLWSHLGRSYLESRKTRGYLAGKSEREKLRNAGR